MLCTSRPPTVHLLVQVKLLQFVRPQDFENFRHFVRWRDTTANILLQILTRAAQVPVSDDDKYGTHLLQPKLASSTMQLVSSICCYDQYLAYTFCCDPCLLVTRPVASADSLCLAAVANFSITIASTTMLQWVCYNTD